MQDNTTNPSFKPLTCCCSIPDIYGPEACKTCNNYLQAMGLPSQVQTTVSTDIKLLPQESFKSKGDLLNENLDQINKTLSKILEICLLSLFFSHK